MKSSEVRFADAVAALRTRLEAWSAPDAHAKAIELVREMQALGWRPTRPDDRPTKTGSRSGPTPEYLAARAANFRHDTPEEAP